MTDFVLVARLEELAEGMGRAVSVDGREIALFRIGGAVYAIDNSCPHKGGPLSEGELEGATVICPLHGWRFDVTTGANPSIPAKPVAVFEVKIENGQVYVRAK